MFRINKRIEKPAQQTKTGEAKKIKGASMPPESMEQANQIFDELWERSPILCLTAQMSSLTGLRYSDASWLRYDDFFDEFDQFKSQFEVCQQKVFRIRESRKSESENTSEIFRKSVVTIYTSEAIKEIVEETRHHSSSASFLFGNKRSQLVTDSGEIIERPMSVETASWHHLEVKKKLKLGYTLGTHSWRKFYVRLLIDNGATVEKVRDLLGQSSLQSTNHYLHSIETDLNELVNKLSLNKANI